MTTTTAAIIIVNQLVDKFLNANGLVQMLQRINDNGEIRMVGEKREQLVARIQKS